MKTILPLFVGLCLTASVAFADATLSAVNFAVGQQQFKAGDTIVIDQVMASSSKLAVGDTVVVRGHYQLASASEAVIGLYATHPAHSITTVVVDRSQPSQTKKVKGPAGSFELSCEVKYAGALHISFYPTSGGEALGGVYFMPR
ncbi:MAG: hypothetical protein ABI273_04370 [Lacunisphaera sp.]